RRPPSRFASPRSATSWPWTRQILPFLSAVFSKVSNENDLAHARGSHDSHLVRVTYPTVRIEDTGAVERIRRHFLLADDVTQSVQKVSDEPPLGGREQSGDQRFDVPVRDALPARPVIVRAGTD